MSIHYQDKAARMARLVLFLFVFLSTAIHAEGTTYSWQEEVAGENLMLECTIPDISWGVDVKVNGICEMLGVNRGSALSSIFDSLGRLGLEVPSEVRNFVRDDGSVNVGNLSTINAALGGFGYDASSYLGRISIFSGVFGQQSLISCKTNAVALANNFLDNLCGNIDKLVLDPAMSMITYSIDTDGFLPNQGSGETVPIYERKYAGGLTGKDLYDEHDGVAGGMAHYAAHEDPSGAVAKSLESFDKPEMILSDMAYKLGKDGDASAIQLPATKAKSIDDEDNIAKQQAADYPNFQEISDSIAKILRKGYLEEIGEKVSTPDNDCTGEIKTLAAYKKEEDKLTTYYLLDQDGEYMGKGKLNLETIMKQIASYVKADYASKHLLLTADPAYIIDPSEAMVSRIAKEDKLDFRYAAFVQQEKNKEVKIASALILKKLNEYLEIIKKQARIKASIFRDDLAKCEIEDLLKSVDESIDYCDSSAGGSEGSAPSGTN